MFGANKPTGFGTPFASGSKIITLYFVVVDSYLLALY
jgi:hypothetical protein